MEVKMRRLSIVSQAPFEEVVQRLTASLGHIDIDVFHNAPAGGSAESDLRKVDQKAVGRSDLIEFSRFDAGTMLGKKENGHEGPRILRLLVGNPIIMADMVRTVPDAAAYLPITILIDERDDGVHLSYDLMASVLAPYNKPEALRVAKSLDIKVEALLRIAAGAEDERQDKPANPIDETGSLAAVDLVLRGGFLGDW